MGIAYYKRVGVALAEVEADYDIAVIDCPAAAWLPHARRALCVHVLLITIHPQMVDVTSMSQFLLMTADLLAVVRKAGGELKHRFHPLRRDPP